MAGACGAAAGDLALQELCTGGLWVGGGTVSKQLKGLQSAAFLNAMRDKGRFRELIEGMQVTAVIDPDAGLFSAACRARMLESQVGHGPIEDQRWQPRIVRKRWWTSRQPLPISDQVSIASAQPSISTTDSRAADEGVVN